MRRTTPNTLTAQMIVLHVCKGQGAPGLPNFLLPDDPDKMPPSPQEKLDELCRQHISPELDAITLLRTSDTPFLEISEVAEEFKADLIVMTSGGSKALSDVFRGSTDRAGNPPRQMLGVGRGRPAIRPQRAGSARARQRLERRSRGLTPPAADVSVLSMEN